MKGVFFINYHLFQPFLCDLQNNDYLSNKNMLDMEKDSIIESYTKPISFSWFVENYDFLDDGRVEDEFESEEDYEEALCKANGVLEALCVDSIPNLEYLESLLYELAYYKVVIDTPLRDAILDMLENDDDLTGALDKIKSYNCILRKKQIVSSYMIFYNKGKFQMSQETIAKDDLDTDFNGDIKKYRKELSRLNETVRTLKQIKDANIPNSSIVTIENRPISRSKVKYTTEELINTLLYHFKSDKILSVEQLQVIIWKFARAKLVMSQELIKAIKEKILIEDEELKAEAELMIKQYHIFSRRYKLQFDPISLFKRELLINYDETDINEAKLIEKVYEMQKEVAELNETIALLKNTNRKLEIVNNTEENIHMIIINFRFLLHKLFEGDEKYVNLIDFRKKKYIKRFFNWCEIGNYCPKLETIESLFANYKDDVNYKSLLYHYDDFIKRMLASKPHLVTKTILEEHNARMQTKMTENNES